jgi:DNA modification methylase
MDKNAEGTTQMMNVADVTNLNRPSRNAILHGDCINILGTFAPASVDFALIDPPYIVQNAASPSAASTCCWSTSWRRSEWA